MKRAPLPFDTRHFEKKSKTGLSNSTRETFEEIYESKHWQGEESVSGQGSDDRQTREIIRQIPILVKKLGIKKILDIPCGDFNWFGKMELTSVVYTGGDIIPEITARNNKLYGNNTRKFVTLDLIKDSLSKADMLLCRDCLVHLSNAMIWEALENIKNSPIQFLLTTTFTECETNEDIVTGDWRVINLEKPPFNLPKPIYLINERCTEGNGTYSDKSLGLWKISDLQQVFCRSI
jgi:hypothetical protein